jgi:hypothetical protein
MKLSSLLKTHRVRRASLKFQEWVDKRGGWHAYEVKSNSHKTVCGERMVGENRTDIDAGRRKTCEKCWYDPEVMGEHYS